MKSTSLLILLLLISIDSVAQLKPSFSKEEVLQDLKTLKENLIEAHYNIYAYTSKTEFEKTYQKVKASINKDSLSLLATISKYQQLVSSIKNGHTEIDFPVQSYMDYASSNGTLFPLEIALENNIPLVRKNWSDNKSIKIGSVVISINGLTMSEIIQRIYPQVSAERQYFKNTKIELYSFPRYYWQVFGRTEHFEVEIQSKGTKQKFNLKAIDLIEDYESKRTEILNAKMQLKLMPQSAYLNPGNFSGDISKYKHFIDSSFATIAKKNIENLIIDLRNNGGGDDAFSDYLVSYLANKPFKWNSSFTLKTSRLLKEHARKNYDTTVSYWQQILKHDNGEIYKYAFKPYNPQPLNKRFIGNAYVLINRQSHSQAAVTAAQIQDYKFGTLVGEETGDFPSLFASQFQFVLPTTGITVKISKGKIVRVNGNDSPQGVIPNVFIKDFLLDENDEILNGVLELIKNK